MAEGQISRRVLLRDVAYLGGGAVLLAACTSGGSLNDSAGETGSGLPDIEGGEVITDPSRVPASFHESPEFADQVAAGRLPPVTTRIGQDPLVIAPVHSVGTYGGEIRRAYIGVEDIPTAYLFCAGPDNLLYWDYRHKSIVPNIARGYEMSDDFTELVVHLRRGMHWSDGQLFTADDIVFWRYDINLDPTIGIPSTTMSVDGRPVVVEKVDDYTVRYRAPVPYAALPEMLAGFTDVGGQSFGGATGGGGFAPKHYLSRFHPKYTSEETANATARDAGFADWVTYLLNQSAWHFNPDLPVVTPWIVTRPINDPPWEFGANPYSIWVDTDGNQLPYIPTITMADTADTQVEALRAAAGQYDFQDRGLQVKGLPVLLKGQDRGGYTIHQAPGEAMDCAIYINLAYDKEPEIGDLLREVNFRRALSLAVDRDEINETFFLGTSVPSATMASDNSPYFPGKAWRARWATYDPDRANQLLDEIGLSKRDEDGFRLLPSGDDRVRLSFQSSTSKVDFPAIAEAIRRQWDQIGIDATSDSVDGTLLVERTAANEIMISVNTILGTEEPFMTPFGLLPASITGISGTIGYPYVQWFLSDGLEGTEPPESLQQLKTAMRLYRQGLKVPKDKRTRIGQQIFRLHADQVWSIGVVGFGIGTTAGIYYAKDNLRNVPARVINSTQLKTPTNTLPMTFYYED
jgi:peptide/nickel transport system substrate-binding protein